jgi:hypothetical protein
MTDSRYVVVARNKRTKELEPVHPGHTSHADALRLKRQLVGQGIPCELWKADAWERHTDAEQADLFCDVCGLMKEDCSGHPEEMPAVPADAFQLPDLSDPQTQDRALELLVELQNPAVTLEQQRLLAAIHNKLYDEWAEQEEAREVEAARAARIPKQYRVMTPGTSIHATRSNNPERGNLIVRGPYQHEPGDEWWLDLWQGGDSRMPVTTPCHCVLDAMQNSGWELRPATD